MAIRPRCLILSERYEQRMPMTKEQAYGGTCLLVRKHTDCTLDSLTVSSCVCVALYPSAPTIVGVKLASP